tara:strand:+ start:499 stop:1107 length:609 start_codon:yes stop_codon:yes gene_type:complete
MSNAFYSAWNIAKKSSKKPLNEITNEEFDAMSEGTLLPHPEEGYQDFRFPFDDRDMMAGNYPAVNMYASPTFKRLAKVTRRKPDGRLQFTGEPTGSNINLSPLAHHVYNRNGELPRDDERSVIQGLASTGRHEAIHQAVHPILRDLGYSWGTDEYSRATEYFANLGQEHDAEKAWGNVAYHDVFNGDKETQRIADKYRNRLR